MPSNSASHQAQNYVQRSSFIAKYFKTLRCGCVYFFSLLKLSTVTKMFILFVEYLQRIRNLLQLISEQVTGVPRSVCVVYKIRTSYVLYQHT